MAAVAAFRLSTSRDTRCGERQVRPAALVNTKRAMLTAAVSGTMSGRATGPQARAGILVFARAGVVQWQNVSFPS